MRPTRSSRPGAPLTRAHGRPLRWADHPGRAEWPARLPAAALAARRFTTVVVDPDFPRLLHPHCSHRTTGLRAGGRPVSSADEFLAWRSGRTPRADLYRPAAELKRAARRHSLASRAAARGLSSRGDGRLNRQNVLAERRRSARVTAAVVGGGVGVSESGIGGVRCDCGRSVAKGAPRSGPGVPRSQPASSQVSHVLGLPSAYPRPHGLAPSGEPACRRASHPPAGSRIDSASMDFASR